MLVDGVRAAMVTLLEEEELAPGCLLGEAGRVLPGEEAVTLAEHHEQRAADPPGPARQRELARPGARLLR